MPTGPFAVGQIAWLYLLHDVTVINNSCNQFFKRTRSNSELNCFLSLLSSVSVFFFQVDGGLSSRIVVTLKSFNILFLSQSVTFSTLHDVVFAVSARRIFLSGTSPMKSVMKGIRIQSTPVWEMVLTWIDRNRVHIGMSSWRRLWSRRKSSWDEVGTRRTSLEYCAWWLEAVHLYSGLIYSSHKLNYRAFKVNINFNFSRMEIWFIFELKWLLINIWIYCILKFEKTPKHIIRKFIYRLLICAKS